MKQVLACLIAAPCLAGQWNQLPPLPDHLGVAAPFAGISGGSLLVAGGANFPNKMPWEGGKKAWTDAVWILDKIDGSWREAGKLPRLLAYGVSVTHNDSIVCVGGSDAERHYAEAFRLTWKLGKLAIEQLPALPMPLSAAGGAISGDTLYIACGAEKPGELAATNRAFAMDLAAKNPAWREIEPLPGAARILATAAVHDEAFYLFGGASLMPNAEGKIARVFLREAWSYRPAQGWKRCADLPKPNVAAPSPAPFVDGKLLLLAGDDGSKVGFQPVQQHPGFPKTILAYSPVLDQWSEAGEVPAPRATVPCVPWQGAYIIPSGEVRPGVRSPEVWKLSSK